MKWLLLICVCAVAAWAYGTGRLRLPHHLKAYSRAEILADLHHAALSISQYTRGQTHVVVIKVAHPSHYTTEAAAGIADAYWFVNEPRIVRGFRNGQCTDLAQRRRPDIVKRIVIAAVEAKIELKNFPRLDFTAKEWAKLARAAGLRVSGRPAIGAIGVFQPGVDGAGAPWGHVDFVTRVGTHTFTTIDENVGHPYATATIKHRLSPVSGRLFILR